MCRHHPDFKQPIRSHDRQKFTKNEVTGYYKFVSLERITTTCSAVFLRSWPPLHLEACWLELNKAQPARCRLVRLGEKIRQPSQPIACHTCTLKRFGSGMIWANLWHDPMCMVHVRSSQEGEGSKCLQRPGAYNSTNRNLFGTVRHEGPRTMA